VQAVWCAHAGQIARLTNVSLVWISFALSQQTVLIFLATQPWSSLYLRQVTALCWQELVFFFFLFLGTSFPVNPWTQPALVAVTSLFLLGDITFNFG
jgi:hypothetical protein